MEGSIHSVETCGTVDGPGIRFVIFLQGCPFRCQYCHNPDSWQIRGGKLMSADELIAEAVSYMPFMESSGGGITVSGGEALLQLDFLIELFQKAKKEGIHTTLDTSGGAFVPNQLDLQRKMDTLLAVTDLVLLDIKHIHKEKHRKLTGQTNENVLAFAKYLSEKAQPMWIRHVLVPTVTDDEEDLKALGVFLATLSNIEKVEILPYHKLGVYKWKALGLNYPLKGIEPPTSESVEQAYEFLTTPMRLKEAGSYANYRKN